MFQAVVGFTPGHAVRADVSTIRQTSLHRHPNALEIVYVLRGDLHAKVSCEAFDLVAGDYAVFNVGDAHALTGSPDNVTAVVHVDLAALCDVDPFIGDIIFACESFDLARHRRQEGLLRGQLLALVDTVLDDDAVGADERCRELMTVLCAGYSLESYYNRGLVPTSAQREKFQRIVHFLRANADHRDVLGRLAAEQHYSKSYVSHFVKEVSGVSFSDLLGYLRIASAENLLLSTDATMLEITAQCGFSDAKYFTRTFVDWFHESPADYRKRLKPDTLRDDDVSASPDALAHGIIGEHRQHVAAPGDGPRLSVTPLLLKNLGSRLDLFDALGERDDPDRAEAQPAGRTGSTHLIPIRVTKADLDGGYTIEGLASFDQIDTQPCLVLEYSTVASTSELVAMVADRLRSGSLEQPVMWLTYNGFHQRTGVESVVESSRREHGLDIQPIMMP